MRRNKKKPKNFYKFAMALSNAPEKSDSGPFPDIAVCDECLWKGNINSCSQEQEGDWESGYYYVDVCPKCGGCVEYKMSEARSKEWHEWYCKQNNKKPADIPCECTYPSGANICDNCGGKI
jgi:hypothetical protein